MFELYPGQVSPFVNTAFQCVSAFWGDFKGRYGTSQVAPPCCRVATVALLLLVPPFPSHSSRGISQRQPPPRSCGRGWDGTSRSKRAEAGQERLPAGGRAFFWVFVMGSVHQHSGLSGFWACGVREPSLLAASYSCQISK